MRRLIAYITTALAMLLCIGVAATPVITNLNTGREFTDSKDYRELVFNIEASSSDSEKNANRSSIVAEEMRARLKNYNIEDYSVKEQGEDTVTVALHLDQNEFNYVAKYLSFSGESFALVSSKEGSLPRNEHTLFDYENIRIEYSQDILPIIVLPVTDDGKQDIKDLVGEFNSEDSHDNERAFAPKTPLEVGADDEDSSSEDNTPKDIIYLWANFDDSMGDSLDTVSSNPLARDKVLMAFSASNIWYEDSKEEETEIKYVCGRGREDDPNQLDIDGLKDFNAQANYLVNMLKASKYEFEISSPLVEISSSEVDYYKNAKVLTASSEPLLSFGNNYNIRMSKTFIATMVVIILAALMLVIYFRLSSLAIIATSLGTLFVTLISFTSMQVLFNIPSIIGFLCLAAGTLFGEILYVNRFKEEVYKGRTIKKANQEASKKSNLLTLDSAIVLAFAGLMMYGLGGTALKPMGVVLFFGAIFMLLMNLLVFKLLMYLLTNSTNLQTKYNVFNIDGEKVPNIMDTEEKPTYESPYEKVNFTKKKSLISVIFGALSVAALTCIIVFGAISSTKSPLNVEKAVRDQTVIYTSVQAEGETPVIHDSETYYKYVLDGIEYFDEDSAKDVDVKLVSQQKYDGSLEEQPVQKYYYFTLTLDRTFTDLERDDLEKKLNEHLSDVFESSLSSEITYSIVRNSKELVYTPSQGSVALATGLTIVGICLYFAFRFRPSRALAVLVATTGTTMIAYGAIVGLHFIGTTALTSVAMPLVAVTMLLASLFYLGTEKAMLKEGHLELTREVRDEIMVKALSKSAQPLFIFMMIALYMVIPFLGFGVNATAILFLSALIGELISIVVLLCVCGPLASGFEKLLGKIHLPKFKLFNKDKPKQTQKRNSSEPEETVFIGIND